MFHKLKGNPFISMILAVFLLVGGSGVYLLLNNRPIHLSAEERIIYANENGISYYTSKEEDEGVVVSYYAPIPTVKFYAKLQLEDYGDFIFQSIYDMGTNIKIDDIYYSGISADTLKNKVSTYGKGNNCSNGDVEENEKEGCGYGTAQLGENLTISPYQDLSELYHLKNIEVNENEVVMSEKTAKMLKVTAGDTIDIFSHRVVIKEIISPTIPISEMNSPDFYQQQIDIPFLLLNDLLLESVTASRDAKYFAEGEKLDEDGYDYWKNELGEFRITLGNHETARRFINDLDEWMKNNNNEKEKVAPGEKVLFDESVLKEKIEYFSSQMPPKYNVEDIGTYEQLTEGLSGARLFLEKNGSQSWQVEDDGSFYGVDLHPIILKNTSSEAIVVEQNDFVYLIENIGDDYAKVEQLYTNTFPMTLQPGEEKVTLLLFSYELAKSAPNGIGFIFDVAFDAGNGEYIRIPELRTGFNA